MPRGGVQASSTKRGGINGRRVCRYQEIRSRGTVATGGFDIDSSIDRLCLSLLSRRAFPDLCFSPGSGVPPDLVWAPELDRDTSYSGALSGVLACSFAAFTTYRACSGATGKSHADFFPPRHGSGPIYEHQSKQAAGAARYRPQRTLYSRAAMKRELARLREDYGTPLPSVERGGTRRSRRGFSSNKRICVHEVSYRRRRTSARRYRSCASGGGPKILVIDERTHVAGNLPLSTRSARRAR